MARGVAREAAVHLLTPMNDRAHGVWIESGNRLRAEWVITACRSSSQRSSCSQSSCKTLCSAFPPCQISPAPHLPACSCPLPPLPPLSSAAGPFLPVLPLGGEHGISRPAAEPAHSLIHCRTMDQTSAAPVSTFSHFPPTTRTDPAASTQSLV